MSMRTILPHLTKAAGIAAILGAGIGLVNSNFKGSYLAGSVITAVALRTLSYYLGASAVAGASIGACTVVGASNGTLIGASYSTIKNRDRDKEDTVSVLKTMLGGALIGGTLGYLIESARPLADMAIKLLKR